MTKKNVLLSLVVLAVTVSAPATEFPLELKAMSATEAFTCPGGAGAASGLSVSKLASIKEAPKPVSTKPLYGSIRLGGKGVVFRLDETGGAGKGYDQLIVDVNGNSDLSDDPIAKASEVSQPMGQNSEQATFGPVAVPGSNKGPWRPGFYARLMIFDRTAISKRGRNNFIGSVEMKPAAYLEATVDAAGAKQGIAISDANCDMSLGDQARVSMSRRGTWNFMWGDAVLRDLDGSGKFDTNEAEYLSSLVFFGPNPYTLALSKDLSAVEITPYDGPVGELVVEKSKATKTMILGRQTAPNKWEALTPHPVDGKTKVPAGTYALHACSVEGKGKGDITVTGSGVKSGPSEKIEVAAGKTASIKCGAPLQLRVQATKRATRSTGGILGALSGSISSPSRIDINVDLAGAGGEKFSLSGFQTVDTQGRQSRPQAPRFKVLDSSGNEVAAGQLEYG